MNYHIKNQEGKIILVGSAKNKSELREKILHSEHLQEISLVEYGKKVYTMSDIYAGR